MQLPFFFANRFVAGETFNHAIPKIRQINEQNVKVTLDLLGENVTDKKKADETTRTYIQLLRNIEKEGLDSTISVKLTMMGLNIDQGYCKNNLFKLLDVARQEKQFVRLDMEGSDHTQATIEVFKEAYKIYGEHVGIVIQAYLHRTKEDIPEMARMGADVRLCKGAYNEPNKIALRNMVDIRKAFKAYAQILFNQSSFPRIATHDDELIDWVREYTAAHDISRDRFEFQMLYGLRQETMETMAMQGFNTRIYVPYGTMWFPYFKRRLLERKENIWFVLSTMFRK